MLEALFLVVSFIKSSLKSQAELALENLALRQQLAILIDGYGANSLRMEFWRGTGIEKLLNVRRHLLGYLVAVTFMLPFGGLSF